MPQLTFEDLKEFHRKYYHPINARIWFYGDDDPTKRLHILSEYLDMFDASSAPNLSRIKPQRLFSEINGMDPFEALKHGKFLMELNARIQKEGSKTVFSPLIKRFDLNNPHKVVVAMQPDLQKFSGDKKAEKEILGKVKAGMTENDTVELVRATRELRLKQKNPDPPEALRCVPSLCLQEIPKAKHIATCFLHK